MQVQDSVSITVRRGSDSWQFFAFIFAAFYALFIALFDECRWAWFENRWLRVATKFLVFVGLFLLIMKSAWLHNLLVQFLGWLITETYGQTQNSELSLYSISLWVMEFLVLCLIAYEVGSKVQHDRKVRARLAAMNTTMAEGQRLRNTVPKTGDEPAAQEWNKNVHAWINQTSQMLQGYSSQAAQLFTHGIRHDASYPGIAEPAHNSFGLLAHRLENLKKIMVNPEVYC